MAFYDKFPYTNFQELNLDWLTQEVSKVRDNRDASDASAAAALASEQAAKASETAAAASQQAAAHSETAAAGSEAASADYLAQIGTHTAGAVADWLKDNITPTTPAVDASLTISGAAADAKKTGDAVSDLKSHLSALEEGNDLVTVEWEQGSINSSGANVSSNTAIRTTDYIDLSADYVRRIITDASMSVSWFWYDANKAYLSKGSATINGTYNLTVYATASYVRFTAVNLDPKKVRIAKDAQTVILEKKVTATTEAHNQLANGLCVYTCDLSVGTLNTSTGEEVVNNTHVRTDYINISDAKLKGYSAPVGTSVSVIEYDSNKAFIRRKFYDSPGVIDFLYDSNTVYVRITWPASSEVKLLQDVPFVTASDKRQIIDGLRINISDVKNLSEKCVHHDNFSRTMTGYEIGKNSEGTLTDNSYDTVTGASTDDGVRVDNGLTIVADNSRTPAFTVRKINATHSANFMIEFNAPESGQGVDIIYKLADSTNFEGINITYTGTYYRFLQRTIVNGAIYSTIEQKNVYNSLGYVIKLYFLSGIIAVYIDNKFCHSFYADSVDNNIYIGAYRAVTAHFDFINVFDLIPPLVWDSEYLTDDGVSELPNSTISANADRYGLDAETTRFSNRSEHFMLYSTDEKTHNGRRTERSLAALIQNNLRTMRYEFDVLFPSTILPDTATGSYGDIFFQLHDRQAGVSRGHVPLDLSLVGKEIHLSQYYASAQASGTLTEVVSELNIGEVTYDKWMHFDIYIKERYAENQHPFIDISINGQSVYQSRKPNCANDVKGSSAQYGEYKNNFDLINYSERYVDNFKVTY